MEKNELPVKADPREIARGGIYDFIPRTLSEAMKLAEIMAGSSIVPDQYRNRPGDVLVAIQYGSEIGLKPFQSVQGIAVIGGRPTVWGDHALAIVLNSGLVENYKEMTVEEIKRVEKATFWIKRRGLAEPIVREFSKDDAIRAGLWNNPKKDPWMKYPFRMMQMRARSWGLRDGFADALKGLSVREEIEDYIDAEIMKAPVYMIPRRTDAPVLEIPRAGDDPPAPEAIPPAGSPAEAVPLDDAKITPDESSKLWGIGYAANKHRKSLEKHQIEEILHYFGYKDTGMISKKHYAAIREAITTGKVPDADPDPELAPVKGKNETSQN